MGIDRNKINANAEKLVKAGKIPEAIAEYKRLVEDSPRDMGVLNKLGDLCARAGKNQDAMRFFLRIAEFYAGDGFFLKAIAMYKKVSKLDPANIDCQQKLAGLYQQQGLTIEAKAQYLAVADRFIKAGQIKKALEVFPHVLEIEPDNIKARMTYADLLVKVGSQSGAGREYRQVAQDLAKKGMLDEAIKIAQKGAKIVPGDPDMMSLVLALTKEAEKSPGDLLASVEQMAKANGENPRSLALLGEAYLAAGKSAMADKVFQKLCQMEDAPPEVAAAVTRFHVSKKDEATAFEWATRAVDGYLSSSRAGDAAGLLDEFLRAIPGHKEALKKRASVAAQAGDNGAEVEALTELVGALTKSGAQVEVVPIVERLTELEPQNSKHSEMLASLRESGAAPPAAPSEGQDIQAGALDLAEEPSIEIGSAEEEVASGADALGDSDQEISSGPQSKIQEMAGGPDQEGEEAEDDDFISEHFTEAEVFVKYGLLEKAKEQLLTILGKYPKHVPSHAKLKEIYYEEGDKEKAVEECLSLATLLRAKKRAEEAQDFVNEAIRIDPNNPKVKEFTMPSASAAPPKPSPAAPPKPAPAAPPPKPTAVAKPSPPPVPAKPVTPPPPAKPLQVSASPELELEEVESIAPPEIEEESIAVAEPETAEEPDAADLELEIEMEEEPAVPTVAAKPATQVGAPKPAAATPLAAASAAKETIEKVEEETPEDLSEGLSIEDLGEDITIEVDDEGRAPASTPAGDLPAPPVAAAMSARDPDPEKLGEVDFYIDQGLLEEARAVLFQLQKQHPGSQEVAQRFERANRPAPVGAKHSPAPAGPAASPGLDLEVERAFGAQTVVMPAKTAVADKAPRASKATPVFKVEKQPETVADDGDFFDLAGELDRSLAEAQVAVESPGEASIDSPGHSIEEIFKAFRKGVEQQVDSQDYETHYNLGIAYKEMGLMDEAIGEFQYAARDASKTVECCEILGMCFREKGMPQLALKWYKKGLDTPNLGEHEAAGLRYDIAEVHREQGDYQKAMQFYTEVYGLDSTYRDVSAKIKEMKKLLG